MENQKILGEIIVQVLGFAVVFLILRKLAWSKILGAIDARRKTIEMSFAEIEEKKRGLENMEKDYRARLEHIEEAARVKIQEAAALGQNLARDIQAEARREAEKLAARAKAEIEEDIAKAKISLRHEVAELSTRITEKVLAEKLSGDEHAKLVERFLKELERV